MMPFAIIEDPIFNREINYNAHKKAVNVDEIKKMRRKLAEEKAKGLGVGYQSMSALAELLKSKKVEPKDLEEYGSLTEC